MSAGKNIDKNIITDVAERIGKKYFAFISYKREDAEWAIWLQHELEHYHLPASFDGRSDIPQELRPVFRDEDELSAGNLPEQIKQALINSQNLVVICSPQAAGSHWVNQEVEAFISLGRTDRIFPFIVEGNSPSEYFPEALLKLPKTKERLGGNINERGMWLEGKINEKGRDAAFVKVVAGMLGVDFDSLWCRYEKEKAAEERRIREQRNNLLSIQSRYIAEKAMDLSRQGDSFTALMLTMDALPKNLEDQEDRPYVKEAEEAYRKILNKEQTGALFFLKKCRENITCQALSPNERYLVVGLNVPFHNNQEPTVIMIDLHTGKEYILADSNMLHHGVIYVKFSKSGRYLTAHGYWELHIWDTKTWSRTEYLQYGDNDNIGMPESAVWINDKYYLATTLIDDSNRGVIRLDAETKEIKTILNIGEKKIKYKSLRCSNDGKCIAFWCDGYIEYYNIEHKIYKKYKTPIKEKCNIVFNPIDSNECLVATDIGVIYNYKLTSIGFNLPYSIATSCGLAYHPNGIEIAFISNSGEICIKSSSNFRVIGSDCSNHKTLSYSPDGKYLITTTNDGCVYLWNRESGNHRLISENNGKHVETILYDNSRKILVLSDILKLYDISCHMGLYNENVTKIVLSNNQLYLAFFTSTNYIHIVDMESKAIQYSALLPSTGKFMAFSPDNKKLAVKIKDGTVLLIDFNLGSYKVLYKPIQPLEGNEWAKSGDLIFSPNNDIIVSYEKHHIYVCDIQTQSLRTIERKSQSSEIRMSFINDIEFVIDDGEIFIWNSVDMSFRKFNNKGSLEHHYLLQYSHYHHGIELYSFKTKQTKIFNTIMGRDVCVSTDGQYIAVSHPVNFLVNIETDSGKSIMLKDHEETSLGLCVDMYFDKSSGMLITKSREISIWDPSSGKEVFSDELKDIIIADKLNCYITLKDGMIRFIDTEPLQKSLDKQRLRFADRTLTANERKKYYLE